MSKLTDLDLGSSILSIFILIGFIATAIAVLRLTIIGINYIKVHQAKDKEEVKKNKINKLKKKGF